MNIESGTLKIGASTTVTENVLLKYLDKYHELYPNIDISITNDLTNDLVKSLKEGTLDILILNLPMKETKELVITPFLKVHDLFMVGEKMNHLIGHTISLESLISEDFIPF